MDMHAVLSEIRRWPVEERLRLIEEVQDGLPTNDAEQEISDEVRAFLDRRVADADASPGATSHLEEVWSRVVERYRK